jgi:hypothetical protein
MRNTQASCYGTVGNQNHSTPHLPLLNSPVEPIAFSAKAEEDDSRSWRLFGRKDVRLSTCGGPCASREVIEMAFTGAVAL